MHLAMIGSINDEILNVEELALSVIDYLTAEYPDGWRNALALKV